MPGIRLPQGPWRVGWAIDWHTRALPGSYERTELGEFLYRLKYQFDREQIAPIVEIVISFLSQLIIWQKLQVIVPVPPSDTSRPFQPVLEIARAIAERTHLTIVPDALVKIRPTPMLKDIEDLEQRRQLLEGAFAVQRPELLRRKWVLLFDDLYRSGITLEYATRTLIEQGGVDRVYALVLTKTRTRV